MSERRMKVFVNKSVVLVSAGNYAMKAKTVASYKAGGDRFIVLKVDGRSKPKRARLTLVQPREQVS